MSCMSEGHRRDDGLVLSTPYIVEEVREALKDMHPNKASGPDGLTAQFYQNF